MMIEMLRTFRTGEKSRFADSSLFKRVKDELPSAASRLNERFDVLDLP